MRFAFDKQSTLSAIGEETAKVKKLIRPSSLKQTKKVSMNKFINTAPKKSEEDSDMVSSDSDDYFKTGENKAVLKNTDKNFFKIRNSAYECMSFG